MKFRVLFNGKWPVRFHRNVCGNVYSLVPERDATTFETAAAACEKARAFGIRQEHIVVEPADSILPSPTATAGTPGVHTHAR